jgi:maltose O-acetyltransferase
MGLRSLINTLAGSALLPRPIRRRLLNLYGMSLGRCSIRERCFFGGSEISIGDGSFINVGCVFDNAAAITIGSGCAVGHEAMFTTGTHDIGGPTQRAGSACPAPIVVGDGCWIGARAILLPGVTVGAGCVIGAGAVVREDCEPNGLYVGVPARRLRDLPGELRSASRVEGAG